MSAEDLRRTAIHEAAHAVMLEVLGGKAQAFVWRRACGETTGVCGCVGAPTQPENWKALWGVAGTVGELMDSQDQRCSDYFLIDRISAADRDVAGDNWHEHVDEARALLLRNWAAVESKAAELAADVDAHAPELLAKLNAMYEGRPEVAA